MTERPPGKRTYTMSDAALEQRRANLPAAAAAATGPITTAGKAASSRNAWKHGRYSAVNREQFGLGANALAKTFGKPCVTTCPFHPDNPERAEMPCSLVRDGITHAGGSCLDKTVYVHALDALMSAFTEGDMDGMHGLLATEMASNMQLLRQIREGIANDGVMMGVPFVTKDGNVVTDANGNMVISEYRANPLLPMLIKFNESLGINFAELMATPKARARLDDNEDAKDVMQTLLGGIFQRAGKALPRPRNDDGD